MRILVFSDCHLTHVFDKKKYLFLQKVISPVDMVIINGDFWDGYLTTFDRFVNSTWKTTLFPLLKSKKTVYLFGNHDREEFSDSRVSLFSVKQTVRYSLSLHAKEFIFEHGNRIFPVFDERLSRTVNKILIYAANIINTIIVDVFGQKELINSLHQRVNKKMKQKIRNEFNGNQFFICGHSHCPEADIKNKFFNSGSIKFGYAEYLIIDDGVVTLKKDRYSSN